MARSTMANMPARAMRMIPLVMDSASTENSLQIGRHTGTLPRRITDRNKPVYRVVHIANRDRVAADGQFARQRGQHCPQRLDQSNIGFHVKAQAIARTVRSERQTVAIAPCGLKLHSIVGTVGDIERWCG